VERGTCRCDTVTLIIVVLCTALGLLVGFVLPVVIERAPDKAPVLAGPFPEPARSARTPRGQLLAGLVAALFAASAARLGDTWELPAFLLLDAALVALSVIDLRRFLLPNRIVFPLAAASLGLLGLAALADGDVNPFLRALGGGGAGFAGFLALHLVSPRSMGFGDVKLAFVLGLFLAWLGWGELVLGFFLAFAYGAAAGIVLILTRIRSRRDHVPFGPFMAAGALTAVLVGQTILDWYSG
jgi:leader peptidase (prepilin peptidase)/N-methyltransferase